MSSKIEFLFDFASPNAYLSYYALSDIAKRFGRSVIITPVLLGGLFKLTNNQAPMVAFEGVKGKLEYEMLESERFIVQHRLNRFRFNPHFPINTISLMRGFIAADQIGELDTYLKVSLAAMWENEINMGDFNIARNVWSEAGLDVEALTELIQSQNIKDALLANTREAAERGAFGIPTFFLGDEMFFGKERLIQIESKLRS